jgi:hypothetical protein
MGYRTNPDEDLRDQQSWGVWAIGALVGLIIAILLGWFARDLVEFSGLSFVGSTFFVVALATLASERVERLLRKPKD